MKRILFIDRDGTIIREPEDEQIDSFEKLQFVPGAISALRFLREHTDFEFVMVSNQDGLGTASFPEPTFWPVHNFILQTLEGEGVKFDDILIDRHFPEDNDASRKQVWLRSTYTMPTMTWQAAMSLATARPTGSLQRTSAASSCR